jgi:membrane protein
MGPMLVVIISLCGILFSREAVEGKVYEVLKNIIGIDSAFSIQNMIKNIGQDNQSFIAGTVGFIFLMLGATSVLAKFKILLI